MTSAARWFLFFLAASNAPPWFEDVTTSAGITWQHQNGESPERFLPETTTGGVGFLDFDGDGWLDIFLMSGKPGTPCGLYRNLHNGKFIDVAVSAGLAKLPFYGMGVAVGDFDNDGHPDLYLSGYPSGALFHNNGNGTFTDVTAQAGVGNAGQWGASAAWLDFDRDGKLDLFVANYVEFSYGGGQRCSFAGQPAYCAQTEYRGSRSRLFRNQGDGTFQDVSVASGVAVSPGRALGVVAVDADGDGWIDLFVARDASPNLLLVNQHNGTFADHAMEAEVAYNLNGIARSGMGVDAADWNGDGLPDFAVTNFDHEYHALYASHAGGAYTDEAASSGFAKLTQPYVGWGIAFGDFQNSGTLGLLISNGHIHSEIAKANTQVAFREPLLLLSSDGQGHWLNRASEAGSSMRRALVGRGLALADYDNDGRLDALIAALNATPILLHNTNNLKNRWAGVQLQGTKSNRDAVGARVTVQSGAAKQTRWVLGGGSFLSSSDRRLLFGLGNTIPPTVTAEIRWPDGHLQTATLTVGQYNFIHEQ